MTLPGQISYEARVVAQASIDFADPNNPTIARFGFEKIQVNADTITAQVDFARIGLISTQSTIGQLAFNLQIVENVIAPPQIARILTDQTPGGITIEVVKPSTGARYPWTDGHTAVLNLTVTLIDNGPFWPTSNP